MFPRNLVALCATLALAACSASPARPAAAPAPAGGPDAQACAAQGGRVQPLGLRGQPTCVVPYADAGKACSDKRDCSGNCLASGTVAAGAQATGVCQRDVSQNFGCQQRIVGGVAGPALCID